MERLPLNLTAEELFEYYQAGKLMLINDKNETASSIVSSATQIDFHIKQAYVVLFSGNKSTNRGNIVKQMKNVNISKAKLEIINKVFSEISNVLSMMQDEGELVLANKRALILLKKPVHALSLLETVLYSLNIEVKTIILKEWIKDFFDVLPPSLTKSAEYNNHIVNNPDNHESVQTRSTEAKKSFIEFVEKML